ncbi:MAG: SDR family oxidoreductase [Cyclobacteriaceae bacterium]|nr:SDR family oxidoreductase [Cyclobacteriaceae bacterium]
MFKLTDKVALITGAAQGVGKGIALSLAKAGATVILNDRNIGEKTDMLAFEIKEIGGNSLIVGGDVGKENEVVELFEAVDDKFGRIDILVNNAGTSRAQDIFEMNFTDWKQLISNNLDSCFLCSREASIRMRKMGQGRIVNISSVVGLQGALYGHVHYAASKSGMLGFTKTLSRTLAQYGTTVNAVAPGIIKTELLEMTYGLDGIKSLMKSVPLGLGMPEDVGNAVLFLCSSEARYITGATIDVNGGMYMH